MGGCASTFASADQALGEPASLLTATIAQECLVAAEPINWVGVKMSWRPSWSGHADPIPIPIPMLERAVALVVGDG